MSDSAITTLLILSIAWWIAASIAVCRAAGSKGRDRGPWFWLSFFLGPFLAALLLLAYPSAPVFDKEIGNAPPGRTLGLE